MIKSLDISERLMAHVEATKRRDEWALKSEALLKAGKKEAARKALGKAEYWQHRKRLLEL